MEAWVTGLFRVSYDPPCTAYIERRNGSMAGLKKIAKELRTKFPSSSFVKVKKNCGGRYIELDWSEMEYVWEDQRKELIRRVSTALKEFSMDSPPH